MKHLLIRISILIILTACETNQQVSEIPYAHVDITINLDNQQYLDLQQDGGWVYIDGGVRGIILYRKNQSAYHAFERNCSYQPFEACATVEVHSSGFYMEDPCCGSVFDFNGYPTGGPATLPLREYLTFLDGNFLHINNE